MKKILGLAFAFILFVSTANAGVITGDAVGGCGGESRDGVITGDRCGTSSATADEQSWIGYVLSILGVVTGDRSGVITGD